MLVKLDDLKHVTNDVNRELRCLRYLKEQFQKELGPRATGNSLQSLAVHVNDALDERLILGKSDYIRVKTVALIECLKNSSSDVRRMAARLLPEHLADKIVFMDTDDAIVYAAANRASLNALATLLEQNRTDELLFDIAKDRLNEVNDLKKAERLSNIVKLGPSIDINEFWYRMTAKDLIDKYAHPFDGGLWISKAVRSTSNGLKSTSGIEIDEQKLRKEIVDQLNETDDAAIESLCESNDVFSMMIENLDEDEVLNETFNVEFMESPDELLEVTDTHEYIKKFESEYKVKYYDVPRSTFSNRGLDETIVKHNNVSLPGTAYTPHMGAPTERDEKVLDQYVKNWMRSMMPRVSESLVLRWSMSPEHEGKISFNIGVL